MAQYAQLARVATIAAAFAWLLATIPLWLAAMLEGGGSVVLNVNYFGEGWIELTGLIAITAALFLLLRSEINGRRRSA